MCFEFSHITLAMAWVETLFLGIINKSVKDTT
jgi:hypothetical protein